ncbi:hypothetical protein SLOPH_892 [Spraguea lophii 42_110]|uniref:Uncharacterized protein n=1 Tax=Spraguea lophii (strain 42_110) TaxID=1358809 RepID=S7XT59_SPRLO|nr:hypothetical protein SLOPH_892 [Spraguea lophii 42_110]
MLNEDELEFYGFHPHHLFREIKEALEIYSSPHIDKYFLLFEEFALELFSFKNFKWERKISDRLVDVDVLPLYNLKEEINFLENELFTINKQIKNNQKQIQEYKMLQSEKLDEHLDNIEELKNYIAYTDDIYKNYVTKIIKDNKFSNLLQQKDIKREMHRKERDELNKKGNKENIMNYNYKLKNNK